MTNFYPSPSKKLDKLIKNTIETLQTKGVTLNTVIVKSLAHLIFRLPGFRRSYFISSALAFGIIVTFPLVFLLATPYLSSDLAPLFSSWMWINSGLIFLSLISVHFGLKKWLQEVPIVATLFTRIEDALKSSKVMLWAFRLGPQIAFSLFAAALLLVMFLLSFPNEPLGSRLFLSVPFIAMFVFLGNGAYWAILAYGALYMLIEAKELRVNFFDPSSTPGIKSMSATLSLIMVMTSLTFLVFLIGFVVTKSSNLSETLTKVINSWFAFALFVLTSNFLYHQVLYYLVVKREKHRILNFVARSIIEIVQQFFCKKGQDTYRSCLTALF